MKEILGCPHCHTTFGGVRDGLMLCPDCHGELVPLNITKEIWDTYSNDKKESVKQDFFSKNKTNNLYVELSEGVCLAGKYAEQRVYVNYINEFIKFDLPLLKEFTRFDLSTYEKVRFVDITSVTRQNDYEKNYCMIAFVSTFIVIFLCMIFYHFNIMSEGGLYLDEINWFDLLSASIVTGLIWGGFAFVIGYFIRKRMSLFLIQTISNEKFEIALNLGETEQFISYMNIEMKSQSQLLKGPDSQNNAKIQNTDLVVNDNEQIVSTAQRSNAIDKYDDLIKLKLLLDQGILTKDEFDKEKQTVLGCNDTDL